MKNIIILGCNADIGQQMASYFIKRNCNIIGTYRIKKPNIKKNKNIDFVKCDVNKAKDIKKLFNYVKKKEFNWDTLFSSVGTSEPINNFFDLKFSHWKSSVNINFISQMEILHKIYNLRNKKKKSNVIFLAGGGTNNPFTNYSAYCVSKIALIKMCELIDDENKNLNCFIVGPGFTKTKTHYETIKAGKKAGKNFLRVKKFMSKENGTSMKDIFNCILWGIKQGRNVVGGRNLSVVHDDWGTNSLKKKLLKDSNMYKLRRYKTII